MVCLPPFPTLSPPPPKALMSESGSLPCLAARCQARQCEFTEKKKSSLSVIGVKQNNQTLCVCACVCGCYRGPERVKGLPHGVSRARGPHGPGQQHHLHHQPPWRHHRLVAGQQPGSGKPPGKAPLPAGKLPLPAGKQHRFPLANCHDSSCCCTSTKKGEGIGGVHKGPRKKGSLLAIWKLSGGVGRGADRLSRPCAAAVYLYQTSEEGEGEDPINVPGIPLRCIFAT